MWSLFVSFQMLRLARLDPKPETRIAQESCHLLARSSQEVLHKLGPQRVPASHAALTSQGLRFRVSYSARKRNGMPQEAQRFWGLHRGCGVSALAGIGFGGRSLLVPKVRQLAKAPERIHKNLHPSKGCVGYLFWGVLRFGSSQRSWVSGWRPRSWEPGGLVALHPKP